MTLQVRDWTDQASWDAFIGSQATGHFNQAWAWGEAAETLGGQIHRFVVVDGDAIQAAMSVVSNPLSRTNKRQLFVSRGPAVDCPNEEIFGLLDGRLKLLAKDSNAVVAKIEPYVAAGDRTWVHLLRDFGFRPMFPPAQPRSVWVLDLDPTLDELQAAMKSKWRYNIRLATKRGVEVVKGSEADLDDFYRMYVETSSRDKFYIHDKEIYRFIFRQFWDLGQFELLIARFQDKPIAAVTLIHVGRTVWYAYGASINTHRDVMAPHLLQWEAIQWAKARSASVYDFRGVPDVPARGNDMTGVFRFKQGFGGRHLTTIDSYAKGYDGSLFAIWQHYWHGRYLIQSATGIRSGKPLRNWA